jgi:hypothetical protein
MIGDSLIHCPPKRKIRSSDGSMNHLSTLMDLAKKVGIQTVFIHTMLGRKGETAK